MRYLGLDLGSRTLGVAKSDPSGFIASSYTVIRHNEEYDRLLDEVVKLVQELQIEAIVLGYPKNMNNTVGPKGELSEQFQKKLEERLDIPVYLQDERWTTKQATRYLLEADLSRAKRKKVIDKMAAVVILETYLAQRS